MYRGKIVEVERSKGYGFIETDMDQRVFFHQRWMKKIKFRDLKIGDEVVFMINQGPRGLRAHNMAYPSDELQEIEKRTIDSLFKD